MTPMAIKSACGPCMSDKTRLCDIRDGQRPDRLSSNILTLMTVATLTRKLLLDSLRPLLMRLRSDSGFPLWSSPADLCYIWSVSQLFLWKVMYE